MTARGAAIAEEALAVVFARESLRHPRHAKILQPLRAKVERLLILRWTKQQRLCLQEWRHWLRVMATQRAEANAALLARLQASVTAKIKAGTALSQPPNRTATNAFDAAITDAIEGAFSAVAVDLGIKAAASAGQAFARSFLANKGFQQLATDIDATTATQMANAVAGVFASGGTFNDAIAAIKATFAGMKETRAVTIAQTELADAYNQALLSSAQQSGQDLLKTWNLDGEGCAEICQPNADDGAIPLDEDFSSGDDAPPAHPNCDCSISFELA